MNSVTKYSFVLRSTSLCSGILVCITEYEFLLQRTTLHYSVLVCAAEDCTILDGRNRTPQRKSVTMLSNNGPRHHFISMEPYGTGRSHFIQMKTGAYDGVGCEQEYLGVAI